MLRNNILANFLGSGWIALLTLVATPIQIHLLGVEAYGLVGLITVLQIVFGTLDLGLSAAVTQTIAADRSVERKTSTPLTNSVGSVYAIMAVLIGVLLWIAAGAIATRWLKPHTLSHETVLTAVRAIGLYVTFRWPIAFYTGVLNGIQRMDVLNLLKAALATIRIAIGILLITIRPDIALFMQWFAISAVFELLSFGVAAHRLVPELKPAIAISVPALKSVWRFSLTMAAVAILSMLITQLDRILVSKMLSLQAFGYYSIAYTAAIGISLLQISINNASLPAFAEAASRGGNELTRRYTKVSEFTSFAVGLPCILLVFFGTDILRVWVDQNAAQSAGIPLKLLACGFFINAVVSSAYLAAVATRRAGIPATANAIATTIYVPMLYGLIRAFGIVGAASGWLLLNLYYLPTLLVVVHLNVLRLKLFPWIWHSLGAPILSGLLAAGLMKSVAIAAGSPVVTWVTFLFAIPLYGLFGYFLSSPALREALRRPGALVVLLQRRPASLP